MMWTTKLGWPAGLLLLVAAGSGCSERADAAVARHDRPGAASAAQAGRQGPTARFEAMVDSAVKQGFRLEDQRHRKAAVTPREPTEHWLFRGGAGLATPCEIFSIELSDERYSDVVDLEEWQFSSAAEAQQAVEAVARGGNLVEIHLKGHHALWAEGNTVYLVYSRAMMFEAQFKRFVALARP